MSVDLELAPIIEREIQERGVVDKEKLYASFPEMSQASIDCALIKVAARFEANGIFIHQAKGKLVVRTTEEAEDFARNSRRRKVVRVGRRYGEGLVNLQKVNGLSEELRIQANAEELVQARVQLYLERALLRSMRKRPKGLEDE
jgi:hypothetical protein